jgi:hypothetical protein
MSNIDITQYTRTRRNTPRQTKATASYHTVAMKKYRERYSISQYTLMLDNKVKERYMKFCLKRGLSPSRIIQSLIVNAMNAEEAKQNETKSA